MKISNRFLISYLPLALKTPRQNISDFIDTIYNENLYKDLGPFSNIPEYKEGDLRVFPKGTYTITNYVANIANFPAYLQDGIY